MKKLVSLGIIILLLSISLIPGIVADKPTFTKTIYVDDDNTEGPWDGTQEHPYQYIQNAVDNSSSGDTIFVYSGYYKEQINIVGESDSNIKILGEDKNTTLVYSFRLLWSSSNTTISGFTITPLARSGIYVWGSGNTIKNNIFYKCSNGLLMGGSYDNIIIKNIFINSKGGILMETSSDNNRIEGNHFENNSFSDMRIGVYGEYIGDFPTGNIITKNNFLSGGYIDVYDIGYENRFISNYYHDWIGVKIKWLFFIPYRIPGRLFRENPSSHFDFSPKLIPYDIS